MKKKVAVTFALALGIAYGMTALPSTAFATGVPTTNCSSSQG